MPSQCDFCLSDVKYRAYVDAAVVVHTCEGDLHLCQHHAFVYAEQLAAAEMQATDITTLNGDWAKAPAPAEPQMLQPVTAGAPAASAAEPALPQVKLPGDGPMDSGGVLWWPQSKGASEGTCFAVVHARAPGRATEMTCWCYAPDQGALLEALQRTGPDFGEQWPTRVVWAELHGHPDDGRACIHPQKMLIAAFVKGERREGPRMLPPYA